MYFLKANYVFVFLFDIITLFENECKYFHISSIIYINKSNVSLFEQCLSLVFYINSHNVKDYYNIMSWWQNT